MKVYLFSALCLTGTLALADINVQIQSTDQEGMSNAVGNILIQETPYGLLFTPDLKNLPSGIHGFHIHENPSCADKGMAAGGHLDPKKTGKHLGPYNDQGHLGDLPALYINQDGTATLPVLAPRLKKIKEIENHSLMIHEGGDNYSDSPEKLGGGKGRMFCGVISSKPETTQKN